MAGFGEKTNSNKKKVELDCSKQKLREALLESALRHHKQGDLINAEREYREAIKIGYYHYSIFTNLGIICKITGRQEEAIFLYEKAIEISPNKPAAYSNLANLYQNLGNFHAAASLASKSLELNPKNAQALITLGWSQKELGNLDQALNCTLKSLELDSDNPYALINLGGIYRGLGNYDQALASTLKSVQLKPDNPYAHMNLGGIYKGLGNLDQALTSTLKSLELKPDNPDAHMNLGGIYKNLENDDLAIEAYERACQLKPSIKNQCASKLYLPRVLESREKMQQCSEKYLANLRSIFNGDCAQKTNYWLDLSLFTLTYQNIDNEKEYMEEIAKTVHPFLSFNLDNQGSSTSKNTTSERKSHEPPRIGFYFDNPHPEHVIFKHYYNLVKSCNLSNMEIILLKGPSASGKNSKELEKQATKTIQIPDNIELSLRCMKNLGLDVIIYTEMHSSPTPYCLAHNRIAPIQIALPGNSITTGLQSIDYYISSKYTETNNSEKLYTEKLIKLNGLPCGFDEIGALDKKYSRDYFGIPNKIKVVNLMHRYFKFHPDWDSILEEIAQRSVDTLFLLTTKNSHNEAKFKERLKKTAPTLCSKSMFIDYMPKDKYLGLINCSDVMLDPLHRGCGTTAFDAFGLGLPIITLPGVHARSRAVYGLYKIMGINNPPIANNTSEYIDLCIETINMKSEVLTKTRNDIKCNFKKVLKSNEESICEMTLKIKELASSHRR